MKYITRTVWLLSLVSLFTDAASEMLYPVMPLYLKEIGFSMIVIGILEGVAEATAGLSKGYFGKMSDSKGRRLPFVQAGYLLSALAKPMMILLLQPIWVLMMRTMDRLGKGIRGGARDAMLSDESAKENKSRVFGFHRSMDTIGAVIGPLLALSYLHYHPGKYKILFLVAFIPGMLAVIAAFLIKEKKIVRVEKEEKKSFFSFVSYWKKSKAEYKRLTMILIVFALFNSSDVFLLLKAREAGMNETMVIGIYVMYNLLYALFAFPAGILADRWGSKTLMMLGLLIFSCVYFGMGLSTQATAITALFILYGIYAALTEGISKAWISKIVEREQVATAIGTYSAFQSIALMLASMLTGFIWYQWSSALAMMITGVAGLVAILMMGLSRWKKE